MNTRDVLSALLILFRQQHGELYSMREAIASFQLQEDLPVVRAARGGQQR